MNVSKGGGDLLTSYMAMQNAVLMNNMAAMNMVSASDRMLNSAVGFGNSQPLKPSFAASHACDELNIKSNETKMTVAKSLLASLQKALSQDIQRCTPNYAGLDYKA